MPQAEAIDRAAQRAAARTLVTAPEAASGPGRQAIADAAAIESARLDREGPSAKPVAPGVQAVADTMRLDGQSAKAAAPAFDPADPLADIPDGFVRCRVLPKGHKKIATGGLNEHSEKNKFPFHKRGDVLALPLSVAVAQEGNGLLEITDPISRPDFADDED